MSFDDSKRPVSAVLAGPYGHPFHPILVTVPIGSWLCVSVFDIGSHVVNDPGFLTRGAEWLIAIGVLGALAAASVGFLDLLAIPAGTAAYRTGLAHMTLNGAVTTAYIGNFFWRHSTYVAGDAVAAGPLALALASFVLLGVSGFLGGRLAYRYGVRVAHEATQVEGYRPAGSRTGSAGELPAG